MKQHIRYANAGNPTINAIISGLYRFNSHKDASDLLDTLASLFIIPRNQPESASLTLWIKGYGLEAGDADKGITGHFAQISCAPNEDGFTLVATKIPTDISKHPQRAQISRNNPNWGHPVLRSVRKGKQYHSLEEAQAELGLLHKDFPKVSIPNPGKLYIMIYCANRPPKQRMVKHVLEIQLDTQGKHVITCKENTPKPKANQVDTPRPASPETAPGSFSAKIALSRLKKGKPTGSAPVNQGNQ